MLLEFGKPEKIYLNRGEIKLEIVVLDGYTLNPGDLSWEGFEELGNLTVYDRTSYDVKDIDFLLKME